MEEDEIDKNLDKIEFGLDDFMSRRINHRNFAKIIYWLWTKYKKGDDFVYCNELAKFTKLTKNRAYNILNELTEVHILEKKFTGNLIEFHFVRNGNIPIIEKYIEPIKKLLGLN